MTNYNYNDADVVQPVAPYSDGDNTVANATAPDEGAVSPTSPEAPAVDLAPAAEDDTDERRSRTEDTRDAAAAQAAADAQFRTENPDVPVVRAANPDVGGESF